MDDGFHERTWHGEQFELPTTGGLLVPHDPRTFSATMRWIQLDHVRVHLLVAGPHTFTSARRDSPPPVVTLAVGEGEIEFLLPDRSSILRRGDIAVSDEQATTGHRAAAPIRVIWSVVGREHVSQELITGTPFPAFLPRTRLVNSYVAFLSALLTSRMETEEGPNAFLMRAITDLQLSVLAERRRFVEAGDERLVDLRAQIERHIEMHLADRDLGPSSIAQALGISLRYAHQVFNRQGETLAASVRDKRLDAVARLLRDVSGPTRAGELAGRYGFTSRDQLARAFRRRFGATMSEYRLQGPGADVTRPARNRRSVEPPPGPPSDRPGP